MSGHPIPRRLSSQRAPRAPALGRYQQYATAGADLGEHHPVLLSGLFVLDLLVIHPFEDGNGRVARLLTNAMLSDHGYTVGRYVSLEDAVAESVDAYYQALLDSTHGWHEGTSDPWQVQPDDITEDVSISQDSRLQVRELLARM
jgi:Fic family protein